MELIRRFVETSTLANLGWELSRYAASIKKKSAKEWKEWVDGLIEKIEELQNFKKSMVRPEGK